MQLVLTASATVWRSLLLLLLLRTVYFYFSCSGRRRRRRRIQDGDSLLPQGTIEYSDTSCYTVVRGRRGCTNPSTANQAFWRRR